MAVALATKNFADAFANSQHLSIIKSCQAVELSGVLLQAVSEQLAVL